MSFGVCPYAGGAVHPLLRCSAHAAASRARNGARMPGAQIAQVPTWPAVQPPPLHCGVVLASAGSAAPIPEDCPAFQALVHPVTILIAHVVPEARQAVKRDREILVGTRAERFSAPPTHASHPPTR